MDRPTRVRSHSIVVPSVVIAQALAEKGLLDGAISGASNFLTSAVDVFQARPYLLIVVAVVLFFLLKPKR